MKKVVMIGMVLVLALGMLGAAYAAWTDQVVIKEVVNTGEVLVGIWDLGTDDSGPLPIPGQPDTYTNDPDNNDPGLQDGILMRYDKNVAQALSLNDGEPVIHADGTVADSYVKSITEVINNGYPSYAPTITIEIANLGTIPVIMDEVTFEVVNDPNGLGDFVILHKWQILKADGVTLINEGTGNWADLDTYLEDANIQIEPGDGIILKLTKHIEQDAPDGSGRICPELGTVTYQETLHFIQWNEA